MIKDFLIALGNYNKYGELLKGKAGRTAAYVIVLFLICSIGTVFIPTISTGVKVIGGLWQTLPEFTITHEGMTVSEEYDLDIGGVRLFATNGREVTEEDFGDCITGAVLDADSVIIRNIGKTAEFSYREFDPEGKGFTVVKNDLPALKPYIVGAGMAMCLVMFVTELMSFLLNAVFIGAVSSIVAMFMRIIMPLGKHIRLALYAKTLPLVISAVLTPFGVPMYSVLTFAISMFIIVMFFRTLRNEAPAEL